MYNEKIMELFRNPNNLGTIENPDGKVKLENLVCGDEIEFYMKVENEIITEMKFKTFGCAAAIAASSIITEMVIGKTLEEVMKITSKDVIEELGGIPPIKRYCIELVVEALPLMIEDYKRNLKMSRGILFDK
jgi:nitrogen fixation NifU-like protein